ncbi:hypothetical protein PR048_001214 [Dryococelus australis]|uniref:Peptidase A2 domain-containing protein n=1 Tax=Dryococelus australis TaxID=614101 RepID=A0ABQ9IGV9_9NEOP|nr:hypothetical protein PR048_001214 [Dryococelus australis]
MWDNEVTKKYVMEDEKKEAGTTVSTCILAPPASFDFRRLEGWGSWFKRFQRYRLVSGLSEKSDEIQGKNPHTSEIQGPSQSGNEWFLASANGKEISSSWRTEVNVGAQAMFKIDMGADVTVVPEQMFGSRYSASYLEIKLVNTKFFGSCWSPLKIECKITTPITWRGNTIMVNVYVVQGLKEPLLGWSAIELLGMLQWVEEVNQLRNKFDPRERYPKFFEGLGLMAATYTIRLKDDAVPVSLHAPHRVALPLQPKLQQEIDS